MHTSRPSIDNSLGALERGDIFISTRPEDGRSRVRKESERGAIGVSKNVPTDGWAMGPPAERE